MVRKFSAFFLAFLISLSVFCIPAFAWEPSGQDEYTLISLKLPDGRLYPAVYMPIGSDGYTASWRLDVTSHGFTVYWDTDDAGDVENFTVASLLSLYGLSSGNLIGLSDSTGVRTEYEVEGGPSGDPDIPKNFIFEAVFSDSVPLPPEPDPNEYTMEIYNQSGKLLKTLSGSGTGSPFKAVILPGVNRLVLSVFDSSWEFSSKDLLRLELDPSMLENVSASQIINAGTSGFKLTSLGNTLRVTLIYDEPDPVPSNEYIMEIYNQSGELLETLSGSGIGSPFKAVIYPSTNRLVLSVFDSSWEATSKDLSHLHLDPSLMENVTASQIINAGTSGFKLTADGNLLRVVVIYNRPTPGPSPDSGSPPSLAYFGAFLTTVLGSFFSFELIPGLTLGGMFGFFIVLAIAVCVLKHFQG